MAPKNFKELEAMMEYAVTLNKPVVIRYPRGGEGTGNSLSVKELSLGKCEKLTTGKDVTIVAIGNMVPKAIEVANELKKHKINAEVINSRFLKPFDNYGVLKSIEKTKFVITIEDGTCIGGLSSTIKELIVDNKKDNIKFNSYCYPDKFIEHGSVSQLEDRYGFNIENIVKYIKENI